MTRLVCLAALALSACADSAPEPMTLGVSNVTERRLTRVEFSVGEAPLGAIGPVDRFASTVWQDAEPAAGAEGAYRIRVQYGLGAEETVEVPRLGGDTAGFLHVRVTPDSLFAETATATVGVARIAPDAPRAAPADLDAEVDSSVAL